MVQGYQVCVKYNIMRVQWGSECLEQTNTYNQCDLLNIKPVPPNLPKNYFLTVMNDV